MPRSLQRTIALAGYAPRVRTARAVEQGAAGGPNRSGRARVSLEATGAEVIGAYRPTGLRAGGRVDVRA
jgi:hypothetical protein